MLTEDYIMRMINQALTVFLQALGFKKAGRYSEAAQAFEQAVEVLLGLRAGLVDQLEDGQLLKLLTFRDRLDTERLLLLADIYRERGELGIQQENSEVSIFAFQRSLRLYLEAALGDIYGLNLDIVQKIESVRGRIQAESLPVESRLALLDYFDRLNAMGDDFVTTAGLTRGKLRVEKESIARSLGDIIAPDSED